MTGDGRSGEGLQPARTGMRQPDWIKFIFAVLMAAYGIACLKDLPDGSMLDRVNLVSHEAGHLFFSWFGEFIQCAGGTIGQLFVPSAFVLYFFLRRELFSSAVAAFWAGQNFLGISVYIRDARAMVLPLVSVGGGEDTIHDWNYLLSRLGMLNWDRFLGTVALLIGVVIMALSVAYAVYCSFQQPAEETE